MKEGIKGRHKRKKGTKGMKDRKGRGKENGRK